MNKLTVEQIKRLKHAEDLASEAAGIIDGVINEHYDVDGNPVDTENMVPEIIQEAYEGAYTAMLVLANLRVDNPLDGTAPTQSCT